MWSTTKGDEEKLRIFERKILRIYGPVFNTETQQWELRSNAQLENLYKKEDIVQFTKV